MRFFKKSFIAFSICFIVTLFSSFIPSVNANVELSSPSYVLMDKKTGEVLLKNNENERRAIASVTKIMTMLLTFEEIEKGNISLSDKISASENATKMGGSQIYLKEHEEMTLETLIKSVFVASANDSCVAIAEHLCGNEESFVVRMNERAKELGLKNSSFKNPHGLDEDGHYSSAYDLAVISRELMKYDIQKYTTIWQDTIRNGEFTLSNTNKLIRFYPGATGLKTGSTSKAKNCISATAKKGDFELIAIILGAPSSKDRFNDAKALLNYGFSNYKLLSLASSDKKIADCEIEYSNIPSIPLFPENDLDCLIKSNDNSEIKTEISAPKSLKSPVKKGDKIGEVRFLKKGEEVGKTSLVAGEDAHRKTYFDIVKEFMLS